jgi:hypothetical protein
MIEYEKDIIKAVKKGKIPEAIFVQIHHCFQAIESVGDLTIFDIKQIKGEHKKTYYRLRKGELPPLDRTSYAALFISCSAGLL